MRVRRLLSALLTTALVGSTAAAVATAPPAAAGGTATTIVGVDGAWLKGLESPAQPGAPVFGTDLRVYAQARTADGTAASGTFTLERLLAGEQAWSTIATYTGTTIYETPRAVRNATYRLSFDSADASISDTSAVRAVKVQRNLNAEPVSGERLAIKGKVAPKYAKKKVIVQKRFGRQWKRYSVVRTDGKSRYFARVKAPARRGGKIDYRIVVPAGGGFATSTTAKFTATTY